jgi:hypothetical protein
MTVGSIKNIGDGDIVPGDPYSNQGAQAAIDNEIQSIYEALKAGKDVSMMINDVMNKIQNFGSNVIGQYSESQTQLTKYLSGVSNVQSIVNDQDGTARQDIDKYTGKGVVDSKGNPVYVSPTKALEDQLSYLLNDPQTKYMMKAGPDGPEPTTNPPTPNPSYAFFQSHPDLYDSMKSNIQNFVTSLKNPSPGSGTIEFDDGNAGYNNHNNGIGFTNAPEGYQDHPKSPGTIDANTTFTTGSALDNMWEMANQKIDPTTGAKPDPSILNQVTSAIGSINQSYTSASSAVQTVSQTKEQTFNAEQGMFNKFMQAINSLVKSFTQAQKTQ